MNAWKVTEKAGLLKIGGVFNNPAFSVNFQAFIHETADPNGADDSNLVATSNALNVITRQQGQNIALSFPAATAQLVQGRAYTWIVVTAAGHIGDRGLKGSNDEARNPGGKAYVWNQNVFQTGVEITGNYSFVPRYYYFALCEKRPQTLADR